MYLKIMCTLLYRYLLMFFVVLILGVSGIKSDVKPIQKTLAVEVLKHSVNLTKNTVVSILPLQFSLCKLASVAHGEARNELLKVFGYSDMNVVNTFFAHFREMLRQLQRSDLILINKIYHNYIGAFDSKFAENSTTSYGVQVDGVSYIYPKAAANFINKAIGSATYRRIEDVVKETDFNDPTSLVLLTAAHFKASWEQQFDYRLTKTRKFHLLDGKVVETPMMMKFDSYLYYDARDYRVLNLKLMSWGASMTFVQPGYRQLGTFLKKLEADPDLLLKARAKSTWESYKLVLPRMRIKSEHDLTETLRQLGIKEILSGNSTGLNAMFKQNVSARNVFIGRVKQKLFLELDEYGASRINRDWPSYVPETRTPSSSTEFALDRPFYFVVYLELSFKHCYELFTGVFYKPE